jgi:hypothetical protein
MPFFIGAVAEYGFAHLGWRSGGAEVFGQEFEILGDVAHQLDETDYFSACSVKPPQQGYKEPLVTEGDHYQSGLQKNAQLNLGYVVDLLEVEVALF